MSRYVPNTRRLSILLVPALAYLTWASVFRELDRISLVDGSIGVVLGLYVCSHPAANGIDLIFLDRSTFRRITSNWNGIGWLMLNFLVLFVGWMDIVVGTTQFMTRAIPVE
jgi:hypothetical protein